MKKKVSKKRKSAATSKKKMSVSAKKKAVKKAPTKKKKKAVKKAPTRKRKQHTKPVEVLENLIDTAQEEKKLYESIPNKYRKKIKDMVNKCKSKGYVTSEEVLEYVGLEECDNTGDVWNCIEGVLKNKLC